MGRKRNTLIRDFFEDGIGSNAEINCKTCGSSVHQNITNLKRHMQSKHADLMREYEKKIRLENVEDDENDKPKKFSVKLSKNEVVGACVGMVTTDSLPLSVFDSKSFQTLTEQIFSGLQMTKITSRNVMELVLDKYYQLKKDITGALSGKIISLKMDTATRSGRSVLGINVQIIKNKKIVIYTLAMIELKRKHTAEYLKTEVDNLLKSFGIVRHQVYSVTTDNGRNVIKAVELLSVAANAEEEEAEEEEKAIKTVEGLSEGMGIISIKCAAHTLQLAVNDFLSEFVDIISKARGLAKTLRTAAFRYEMRHLNYLKPKLDMPTRWSSTHDMLKRLLELKNFCYEHAQVQNLSDQDWAAIASIVSVLAPIHTLTLKLQACQLLLGDFYKFWLELSFQLKNINSDISKKVLTHIESGQIGLLENDAMYAALYLDPRFRRLLTAEKKQAARKHLKDMVHQILHVQKENEEMHQALPSHIPLEEEQPSTSQRSELNVPTHLTQSSSSLLRCGLQEMLLSQPLSDDDEEEDSNEDVRKAIYEIENYKEKQLDVDTDLMEYWESKKYSLPWLRKLAMIVHAVPATQVSVERSFSALKLILSDLPYNLSEESLTAIMMVKLNGDKI